MGDVNDRLQTLSAYKDFAEITNLKGQQYGNLRKFKMVKVVPAKAVYISDLWPVLWPHLKSAVDQAMGVDDEESIINDIKQGYRIVLMATVHGKLKGAAVIGFRDVAVGRFADVQYLGGKGLKTWQKEMAKAIDDLARAEGCSKIMATGRVGWEKIWKSYTNTGKVVFIKEVL